MKYQLAIFDLDGTLVDSVADLAEGINHELARMHYPTHPLEAFYRFVGNGVRKLCERALPEDSSEETVSLLQERFSAYYAEHCLVHTKPYPQMPKAIQALKDKEMQLAVASNKPQPFTEQIVRHFFGSETFDCILGSSDTRPRKPAPDIITEIREILSISAEKTVLIGDSDVDIQTAINAKISSIGCIWGFRGREELIAAGADFLANTPSDFVDYLTE